MFSLTITRVDLIDSITFNDGQQEYVFEDRTEMMMFLEMCMDNSVVDCTYEIFE